ncbi:DUF7019 family protein [Amycolatopsis sp. NPDC004378]
MFRRKAKARNPLRYLVYLSDSKIEMLLDQMPTTLRKEVASELKIDLKLLSVKLSRPATLASSATRLSKLAVVERHLEATAPVGDLGSTNGYFRARVDLDWAVLDEGVVLFAGRSGDRLVFLGGSTANLVGGSHLAQGLGSHAFIIQQKLAALAMGVGHETTASIGSFASEVFEQVHKVPQRAEFLARSMTAGTVEQPSVYRSYVVGSPLFVELIDEVRPT